MKARVLRGRTKVKFQRGQIRGANPDVEIGITALVRNFKRFPFPMRRLQEQESVFRDGDVLSAAKGDGGVEWLAQSIEKKILESVTPRPATPQQRFRFAFKTSILGARGDLTLKGIPKHSVGPHTAQPHPTAPVTELQAKLEATSVGLFQPTIPRDPAERLGEPPMRQFLQFRFKGGSLPCLKASRDSRIESELQHHLVEGEGEFSIVREIGEKMDLGFEKSVFHLEHGCFGKLVQQKVGEVFIPLFDFVGEETWATKSVDRGKVPPPPPGVPAIAKFR